MITRRHRTSLALGLLATASAAAIYHVVATAQATALVETALARIPGLHAGAVSVDPWSGRVVVSQLRARAGSTTVSIGSIAFRGAPSALPEFIGPAQAAGGSATAQNIDIDYGTGKVHIRKVEASGTELTDATLAAIFDAKSSASLTERMAKFTADEISIPEVIIESTVPGVSQKLVYKDIKLEHLDHGKVGSYTSGAGEATMQFTDKTVDMGSIEVKIGPSRAANVDLGLYARIMTQARKDANEPLTPVYDSFEIDGMELKGKSFSLNAGKMTSGKVSMRQLAIPMGDFQKEVATAPGAKPTPEQAKKSLMFVSDLYASMDFERLEVKDIVGTFGDGDKAASFQIAASRFANFAKARIGELALNRLTVTAPKVLVKFDTFVMRDFDYKNSLDAIGFSQVGDLIAMGAVNPRSFIPSLGQILVTGLDIDVPDAKRTGNANGGASDKFKIGKVDIKASNYMLGIPGSLSFAVDHLTADLPPPKDPQSRQLAEMGYTGVDLTSRFAYTWIEASNTLTMTDASLKGEGMGAVSLKGIFGNVTRDLFVGDAAVTQAALLGAAVTQADFRVENDGLITKLLAMQAKQAGITVEQLQQGLVANARATISQLFGTSSQASAVSDAVASFLKNPKSIQIVAKSTKGFGAADLPLMQNPAELLKRLDVTATANQ